MGIFAVSVISFCLLLWAPHYLPYLVLLGLPYPVFSLIDENFHRNEKDLKLGLWVGLFHCMFTLLFLIFLQNSLSHFFLIIPLFIYGLEISGFIFREKFLERKGKSPSRFQLLRGLSLEIIWVLLIALSAFPFPGILTKLFYVPLSLGFALHVILRISNLETLYPEKYMIFTSNLGYLSLILFALSLGSLGIFFPGNVGFLFVLLALSLYGLNAFANAFIRQGFALRDQLESLLVREKNMIMESLGELGETFAEGLSMEEQLKKTLTKTIRSVSGTSGAIFLAEANTLVPKAVEGVFPPLEDMDLSHASKEKHFQDKLMSEKLPLSNSHPYTDCYNSSSIVRIDNLAKEKRFRQSIASFSRANNLLAAPLGVQNEKLGIIAVINKIGAPHFQTHDESIFTSLATQASITVTNIRLYEEFLSKKQAERDVELAAEIQRSLLPSEFLTTEKFGIHGLSIPAKGVGGDYFDYVTLKEGKMGVIVADVAGKGVPASLVMVMIRSALRARIEETQGASDVLSFINKSIAGEVSEERYATAFYFLYDPKFRSLNFANAGHGPLLLYRAKTDSFKELDASGIPLGIDRNGHYSEETEFLHPGDIVVLYTDGITEAMNRNRELYGLTRLKDLIRAHKDLEVKETSRNIMLDVEKFADGTEQHDDETLLLLKIKS